MSSWNSTEINCHNQTETLRILSGDSEQTDSCEPEGRKLRMTAINNGFDRLEHGNVAARVALDFTSVWDERPSHVETHLIGDSASDKPEALSTGQEGIMKTGRTDGDTSTAARNLLSVTGSHRRTLKAVFRHPSAHNLEWTDVVGLIGQIGDAHEKANSEFVFEVAGKRHVMRKPHTKDLTSSEVIEVRHFLVQAGFSPELPCQSQSGCAKSPNRRGSSRDESFPCRRHLRSRFGACHQTLRPPSLRASSCA